MAGSELALQGLAFVLTYAIHSTLLLGVACLLAPRLARSLAARERLWKTAMFGALVTALVQVGGSMRTPLFHWTLAAEEAGAKAAEGAESSPREFELAGDLAVARDPAGTPEVEARLRPDARQSLFAARTETLDSRSPMAEPAPAPEPAPLERSSAESSESGVLAGVAAPRWRDWTAQGLLAWAAFALGMLVLFGVMCLRLARCMRGREELVDGELRAALDRLVVQAFPLGRRVRLYVAPDLRAPVSFGFVRLSICVPPRALSELGPDEQETMLAHELAHLLRRDPLWLSLAWLVERVFFFQPLNRVARAELHDLAELACDDWAARRTGNRLALASCLARIAEWIIGAPRTLPATSMAEMHGRCRLTQRIERLLDDEEERPQDERRRRWVTPAAFAGLGSLVLVAPGVSAQGASAASLDVVPSEAAAAVDVELRDVDARSSGPGSVPGPVGSLGPIASTGPLVAGPSLPLQPLTASEREELTHELADLGTELETLQEELAGLADETTCLEGAEALTDALDTLVRRVEQLEQRRAALAHVIQVLETLESMPAHPSSTVPVVRNARSLSR